MFLISDAIAATTASSTSAASQQPQTMGSILMMVAFIAIFYFLIIRPQSKRAKQHRDLISQLNEGDEVVTTSGIFGKIIKIKDNLVVLMIAKDTQITVQKPAIVNVVPKGTIEGF